MRRLTATIMLALMIASTFALALAPVALADGLVQDGDGQDPPMSNGGGGSTLPLAERPLDGWMDLGLRALLWTYRISML